MEDASDVETGMNRQPCSSYVAIRARYARGATLHWFLKATVFGALLIGGCGDSGPYVKKEYREDGSLLSVGEYIRGEGAEPVLHGVLREYWPNGQLAFEGRFDNGVPIGSAQRWHGNGALMERTQYQDGLEHGVRTTWWPNGEKESEATLISSRIQGTLRVWHVTGQLAGEYEFADGVKHGSVRSWHLNGKPKAVTSYRNGKRHGELRQWSDEGELTKFEVWDHGVLQHSGLEQNNNEDGG